MAYAFRWHDDAQSILVVNIEGSITWEDYDIVHREICALLEKLPKRIDVIFYDRVGFPPGNAMPHFKKVITNMTSYSNMGRIYTINVQHVSTLTRAIIDTALRVYRIDRAHYGGFVDSIGEAVAQIQRDRAARS